MKKDSFAHTRCWASRRSCEWDCFIRWIPPKATCLPSSVLVVTFCVPLVKGKDEFVSGFRGPALIRFCDLQCHDFGGVSTVCPQLPSLSWAIFIVWNERWSSDAPFSSDFEHLQGMEVLLLRNQEDHKSVSQILQLITGILLLSIAMYCSYLMRLQAPKSAAFLSACPTSTLLSRQSKRPSCFWL